MKNLSNIQTLASTELNATKGGKRFIGFYKNFGSAAVQNFMRAGSVACTGTNQAMRANEYTNAAGDTICVEW